MRKKNPYPLNILFFGNCFLFFILVMAPAACQEDSRCIRPILFGHRGSRVLAPENTLPAFQNAVELGGDGVEMDMQRTKDDQLVTMHDATTGRTTDDSSDRKISDLTLAQVRLLDAGSWFSPAFAGTLVPEIGEIISTLPEDTRLIFDMKDPRAVELLLDFILESNISRRSYISAFDKDILSMVKKHDKNIRLIYNSTSTSQYASAKKIGAGYVRVPRKHQDDPDVVEEAHAAGLLPVISSTYLSYDVALVYANNMRKGVERRRERIPEECK